MQYRKYQPTPVYSQDGFPIMPCHPARARKLMRSGRAVPHHIKGLFGIQLLDRTRAECRVQDVALQIDPGSGTTGVAVVADDQNGNRRTLAALEIKHRAPALRIKMTKRRKYRRARRHRLRHRAPRFDNRKRKPGTLPPSVDSLRVDTMRAVKTLMRVYPISSISIERNKFDTQLMMNPDIRGVEYQRGTLQGTQVRAYVFDRDGSRCVYCGKKSARMELEHVRPRAAGGSNRVDNLVASCRACNVRKGNQPVEEFLADQPELLERITERLNRSDLAPAAQMNAALPAIIRGLEETGLPLTLADAATVAWNRKRLEVRKTHCYDATLQGADFSDIASLPTQVLELKPSNGRSKQKANVDGKGTPDGKPFREQQSLPRHQRRANPAAGHSDRHQRYGPGLIQTGDTIRITHGEKELTGRAVMKNKGTRMALHGTKPNISVKTELCRLMARNTGWTIRRTTPSQQGHRKDEAQNPAVRQPKP